MSDGTTHYEGCWQSGAKHYACAIKELANCSAAFDRQQEQLDRNAEQIAALRKDAERLRKFTIELTDTFRRAMTGREIDKGYSRKLLKEAEELTQKEEGK